MDNLNAQPSLLKQANLSLIRKVIKTNGTATRAEIVAKTKISSTTVRSLLTEMMADGEIESIGYDKSSGGRKAERYRFQPNRYHSAVFCMTDEELHFLLVNICGEIVEKHPLVVTDRDFETSIYSCMDALIAKQEIKSIGLGVPGIVEGGSYWKKNLGDEELHRIDIGDRIAKRYGLPVIMENDLNATTIGIGRCYEEQFPNEPVSNSNIAYLHFTKECVSAGFLAGGRVIRGCNNFAGELGMVPMEDGRLLIQHMSQLMDDLQYAKIIVNILSWICAILNPKYIALGGPDLRKDCISTVEEVLSSYFPKNLLARIIYTPDVWHDYHVGMAYLTAGKIFDEVQFVKERSIHDFK